MQCSHRHLSAAIVEDSDSKEIGLYPQYSPHFYAVFEGDRSVSWKTIELLRLPIPDTSPTGTPSLLLAKILQRDELENFHTDPLLALHPCVRLESAA